MQARLEAHSWLIVHSGLHSMYGFPCNPGRQVQAAALFLSEQTALVPHGVGLQGSMTLGRCVVTKNMLNIKEEKTYFCFAKYNYPNKLTNWTTTLCERIANISLVTNTDRNMISNSTVSIDSAQARTRVLTFSANASLVRRTI